MTVNGQKNPDTGRTYFPTLCDGTVVFELWLMSAVRAVGYCDVRVEQTRAVSAEEAPEEKP